MPEPATAEPTATRDPAAILTSALRSRLRRFRRPADAEHISDALQRVAQWHKSESRESDRELSSAFPLGVCAAARKLKHAIELASPFEMCPPNRPWQALPWVTIFPPQHFVSFTAVLATLAESAPAKRKPQDRRLRSLDRGVIGVLTAEGLFAKTNQDVADAVCACRELAGYPWPDTAAARLQALRRAAADAATPDA